MKVRVIETREKVVEVDERNFTEAEKKVLEALEKGEIETRFVSAVCYML